VKTQAKRVCQNCGIALSQNDEFCPVCALQGALLPDKTESLSEIYSELHFEHYQVLKNAEGKPLELGRGGMGVTYKAIDTHLRCLVALKIIGAQFIGNESARSRFLREARAAASVHHPNVATVHHLGKSGGNYFYAMEFVDGETLQALIRRGGRLEIELALEIITQVAAGLTAIHKQHLVHRDIKPGNIMLTWEEGRLENVKIIDLGLAKGATDDSLSMAGGFIGTPVYASPEQFAGFGTDIRSDLYSLGITLWEMLSGKPPFQGSVAELMDQHQHTAPPLDKLKNIPAAIVALLEVLLAKDPGQRFQNPVQFQQAVARVREAVDSGSRLTADEVRTARGSVAARLPKAKPKKQTIRWVLGLGSLCLAAVAVALLLLSRHLELFNQRAQAATPEKSIAVLPFENISPNKDDAYFADGVQDEILNNLAKINQLKVICRTSVMQYRADAKRDLHEIASALRVANVLEGTVRRDGNHVRVSTELVDASNDHTIWADSYDRDLNDIFAIQSEIAQKVASKLSAQLSPQEQKDIEGKPTDNLEAYDLYLQAKRLFKTWTLTDNQFKENYLKAIDLLEQATQKDPKFTLAYCLKAEVNDSLYLSEDHTPERLALADSAVNEALRLEPDLPEVHLALAFHLYRCYRDYERARVQLAIAAQSLPNNPDLLEVTAKIDRRQGRWEKATVGFEKATALDPRNPNFLAALSYHYECLRRYRDAERIWNRIVELKPDQQIPFTLTKAGWAFAQYGDLSALRAAYEALPPSMKDDPEIAMERVYWAISAREFAVAKDILSKTPEEEVFFYGASVPRGIFMLWLELVQGHHPTMEQFGAARQQLYQKVQADPVDPFLLAALAKTDVALGRKEEAMQEARRAMEMRPISEDALDGPGLATCFARVCIWANEWDLAFEQLNIVIQVPSGIWLNYGELKTDPEWDPVRKDPRFKELLARLAPRN
jgi:TolB-like protein/Flp pilus assembly protein TadD